MFKVGQKVVCVDDAPPSSANGANYCLCRPRNGEVYTIRGIHTEPHIEGYGVYLEELLNPLVIWSDDTEVEWPFAAGRFRPIAEAGPSLLRAAVST